MWKAIKELIKEVLPFIFLFLFFGSMVGWLLYSCIEDFKKPKGPEPPTYSELEDRVDDLERNLEKEQEKNGDAYEKIENAIINLSDVIDDDEVDGYIYLELIKIKETLTDALNDLE